MVAVVVGVIGVQLLPADARSPRCASASRRSHPAVLGAALAAVIALFVAATVPSQGVPPFIYFRF